MEVKEENPICRLCLKKLTENCEPIEETVQYTLNFLTLCPNLTISHDPMMCETCAANLKKCFDFKTQCLCTENCIVSVTDGKDEKVSIQDIYSKVKLDGSIDRVPDNHSVCRLCLELIKDDASMSIRHNVDFIEILQNYFLEMDLTITDDIIVCSPCYNSLQFYVNFVNNYLSIEQRIDEYCKVEGANYKGQVDLRDVAIFISKSVLNIENNSSMIIKDEHGNVVDTKADIEIKFEDLMEVKQEKEELVDNEIQESGYDSFQHHPSSSQSDCEPQLTREKPAQHTCDICGHPNSDRDRLREHILEKHMPKIHRRTDVATQITMHKCHLCDYKTNRRGSLKRHMLTHKTPSEITMYKCELCDYEAKWKHSLERHTLTHKSPLEATMHKCDLCDFETKSKCYIKKHMMIHRTQLNSHKCDLCDYETKRQSNLKRHMLIIHKTPSDVTVYKCDFCDYETMWTSHLEVHMVVHKSPSEITMYKCDECDYESKRKSNLETHMLTHRTRSEVTMYKCDRCDYEAKWKSSLTKHLLTHKSPSEITMYKCHMCEYEAKLKGTLKMHILTHKSRSEISMFKCKVCPYEAKRKFTLKQHMLIHPSS